MMATRQLPVDDAVSRYLDSLRTERSEETISSYYYRLKLFVEWCKAND